MFSSSSAERGARAPAVSHQHGQLILYDMSGADVVPGIAGSALQERLFVGVKMSNGAE